MGSLPVNGATRISSPATPRLILSLIRDRPNSRSPVETPPHLPFEPPKKAGRDGTIDGRPFFGRSPLASDKAEKENRSILKLPRKNRARSEGRRVNFRQKVLVFHFDRDEGGHVSLENLTLNSEPEVKRNPAAMQRQMNLGSSYSSQSLDALNDVSARNRLQSSSVNGIIGVSRRGGGKGTPVPQRRQFLPPPKPAAEPEPSSRERDVDFHFTVDDAQNSVLRFSLPLGPGILASDVIVKANKTGNRVRVLGVEAKTPPGSQRCAEINDRFGLPVRVDSYRISARIDSNGVLFVEAPILPGELRAGQHPTRKST